jgi:hypothetical protein
MPRAAPAISSRGRALTAVPSFLLSPRQTPPRLPLPDARPLLLPHPRFWPAAARRFSRHSLPLPRLALPLLFRPPRALASRSSLTRTRLRQHQTRTRASTSTSARSRPSPAGTPRFHTTTSRVGSSSTCSAGMASGWTKSTTARTSERGSVTGRSAVWQSCVGIGVLMVGSLVSQQIQDPDLRPDLPLCPTAIPGR